MLLWWRWPPGAELKAVQTVGPPSSVCSLLERTSRSAALTSALHPPNRTRQPPTEPLSGDALPITCSVAVRRSQLDCCARACYMLCYCRLWGPWSGATTTTPVVHLARWTLASKGWLCLLLHGQVIPAFLLHSFNTASLLLPNCATTPMCPMSTLHHPTVPHAYLAPPPLYSSAPAVKPLGP
jgi:hypothetical protein